jgi:hypothetical protein
VFLLISYQFLLIFTPIFELKTNKSYKITLLTIASHPIFQISPKIHHFFPNLQKNQPRKGSKATEKFPN